MCFGKGRFCNCFPFYALDYPAMHEAQVCLVINDSEVRT